MIILLQYLAGIILLIFPIRLLTLVWAKVLNLDTRNIRFYFSGRVALFRLAQAVNDRSGVVLLPGYVCNVIYHAFEQAGFVTIPYKTDELCEPLLEELKASAEKIKPVILCLAPIMGADGGVTWINSVEGISWLKKNNIILFVDLCQDVSRMRCLSLKELSTDYAFFSSFNDKSFPGIMGSIVVTNIKDGEFHKIRAWEKINLFKFFLVKLLIKFKNKFLLHDNGCNKSFEYSYCSAFPYTLNHSAAGKLQIAVATAGLFFRYFYLKAKDKYLLESDENIVKTPFWYTSPFVLWCGASSSRLRNKMPYAIHRQPLKSLRPDLLVKHFKGFDDL